MRTLLLVALVAACSRSDPSWHVGARFLRDPDGRAVITRGVNLSGAQKTSPYLDDKQPADYQRVRTDWGMNAVRFIMTWSAVEPERGVYDDAYLDRVAERIDWANASGLLVVLDMHQDVYGEGFGFDGAPRWTCDASHYEAFVPMTPWYLNTVSPEVQTCFDELYTVADRTEHFVDAWRHVATRLGAQQAVIGFDVLNEPSWGSYPVFQFEKDRLAPLYARVVAAVRDEAPHWIAFLEPAASRNLGIATGLLGFSFDNVMYAPHAYDNSAEMGGSFDPAHRQAILDNVADLAREADQLGAGLWIGEYGGIATDAGITDYMTAEYDAAGAVAAGTMYWAYDKGGGYSMLDADGSERQVLMSVLVRPYPERVAGDPSSYAFDAATSQFTLDYTPRGNAATLISVPARVYPSGYQVECGGCTYHMEPGQLVIDAPGASTITIRP